MKKKKFKLGLNTFYSLGAAVVIAGVGCKLLHLPGSFGFIAAGLAAEVVVFMVIAFSPVDTEPDWSRVYPELEDDFDGPRLNDKLPRLGVMTARGKGRAADESQQGIRLKSFSDPVGLLVVIEPGGVLKKGISPDCGHSPCGQ